MYEGRMVLYIMKFTDIPKEAELPAENNIALISEMGEGED